MTVMPKTVWTVHVTHNQSKNCYWLKNTVWTAAFDRAQRFDSREAAEAAFAKFMTAPWNMPRVFARTYSKPWFENHCEG